MVACLASFRVLFTKSNKTDHKRLQDDERYKPGSKFRLLSLKSFNSKFTQVLTLFKPSQDSESSVEHAKQPHQYAMQDVEART